MLDPTVGRWTTTDPIGFAAEDTNLYRYVGNHPTNAIDPTGLAEEAITLDEAMKAMPRGKKPLLSPEMVDVAVRDGVLVPIPNGPTPSSGTAPNETSSVNEVTPPELSRWKAEALELFHGRAAQGRYTRTTEYESHRRIFPSGADYFTAIELGPWPGKPGSKIVAVVISSWVTNPDYRDSVLPSQPGKPFQGVQTPLPPAEIWYPKAISLFRVGPDSLVAQNLNGLFNKIRGRFRDLAAEDYAWSKYDELGFIPVVGSAKSIHDLHMKARAGEEIDGLDYILLGAQVGGDVLLVGGALARGPGVAAKGVQGATRSAAPPYGARATGRLAGAAADSRSVWSSSTGDVVVAGESLPGRLGVEVPRRLTTAEMQALQQAHGVEFALIYELGPGRGGGGGRYLLFSGTYDRVWFPPNGNYIWISHSHPEGYLLQASKDDRLWLGLMKLNGSPQTTSVIAPVDGAPFRFSPTRNRLPDDFMRNR